MLTASLYAVTRSQQIFLRHSAGSLVALPSERFTYASNVEPAVLQRFLRER